MKSYNLLLRQQRTGRVRDFCPGLQVRGVVGGSAYTRGLAGTEQSGTFKQCVCCEDGAPALEFILNHNFFIKHA